MSVQFKSELVDEAYTNSDESSVDSQEESSRQFNKFQLLDLVDGDQETKDGLDDEKNSEIEDSDGESKQKQQQITTSSTSKQKKRKRRNKSKPNKINQPQLIDPLDNKFISEGGFESSNKDDIKHQKSTESLQNLLKLDMRNLIPENELKRMFGKSIVKDEHKQKHHPGLGSGNQRSRFVSATHAELRLLHLSIGPKMELDDLMNQQQNNSGNIIKSNNGDKKNKTSKTDQTRENHLRPTYFRLVHDKSYQVAHSIFLDAAYLGDSESIVRNLNAYPVHIESLIQLSDMLRISEDYKSASELIERALLIFENGFHQRFNFAQANCRLSYKRPENRTLFITIFKHVVYCNRRGLRRTPLEYTKFLLSLDPENDPLFASLMIDFYAIRSEEYDYLINFISQWKHLSKLPNMKFSLALAYFMKSRCKKQGKIVSEENLKRADEYLQESLLCYPNFIIPLLDACSAEPDSGLKECDYFDYSVYSNKYKTVPEAVDLLVNLYVQRNLVLWKTKHVSAWLERNVATLVSGFASKEIVDSGIQLDCWSTFRGPSPRSLLRHIILSDLSIKIPPSAASSTLLDIDPFPPESIVSYQRSSNPANSNLDPNQSQPRGISSLFIRSFLPNFSSATDSPRASQDNHDRDEARPNPANPSTDDQQSLDIITEDTSINLDVVQSHVQNVLASLGNLLIRTETRTPDENDDAQRDNNQRQ